MMANSSGCVTRDEIRPVPSSLLNSGTLAPVCSSWLKLLVTQFTAIGLRCGVRMRATLPGE